MGEELKETIKWIKVTDQLPPISTQVLVKSNLWGVCIDYSTTADRFQKGFHKYWAPLPKGPKK